jgi:7-cyano-7-deazaguanine synthase
MKALVLVSGGLDSAVCLAMAVEEFGNQEVIALNMFYGQKHDKEQECAQSICDFLDVRLLNADLSSTFKFSDCTLLQGNGEMEHKAYSEQLEDLGGSGTVATYVPFRNGLFLAYATAIAYSFGADVIYYGAHADDAAGRAYPDCTEEFRDAMGIAMFVGTGDKVRLEAPLLEMNKQAVVKKGIELAVPFEYTWSCYEGKEKQCGTCGTCLDRKWAFQMNGIEDPMGYEIATGGIVNKPRVTGYMHE